MDILEFACENCYQRNKIISWRNYITKQCYMCEKCWNDIDQKINNEINIQIEKMNITQPITIQSIR